ncbi:RluA family pseudouridine synthase [Campylobacter geochelonis]|uniref:RluA family pseudouridine synthase n=1 Tax=Campylobacter geochelonis TaxID=1780362 RepID=UPI000770B5F4|nr:RluA family pseudouridine synthase [Campylobacter geochelonis]CZE46358.1 putative prophage LambdaCh01%2C recombination protein Bet [Campylobacter geochelonis]CZE50661.1 putative prophage LambdaCh01%2C recombination protein Bet [Campylobacter geochelonis]
MPYNKKNIATATGQKAYEILLKNGYSMKSAQSLIDRGRMINNDLVVKGKNQVLYGDVFLIVYECLPRGLKPVFEDEEFAVFDKPSGVLTHQNGRSCQYSLNDEIISLFGANAKVAHRLDKETSGLILVAKNKEAEVCFKKMFEEKLIKKEYLAFARGKTESKFEVSVNLAQNLGAKSLKNKMFTSKNGKESLTKFETIEYLDKFDISYLRCIPKTGRQHQIRAHLDYTGHAILGDTMYGVSDEVACDFLDEKISQESRVEICGSSRLLLHSNLLEFIYKGQIYSIKSCVDAKNEFLKCIDY